VKKFFDFSSLLYLIPMKKLFLLSLCFFTLFGSDSLCGVFAQEQVSGEIINLNYKYRIAFTDLNNYHIQAEDVVAVYRQERLLAYLKVVESSSAVSKLKPLPTTQKYSSPAKFKDILIGDRVEKVLVNPGKTDDLSATDSKNKIRPQEEEDAFNMGDTASDGQLSAQDEDGSILDKYNRLLEKHTQIVKSLITIKAEKKLLESNNELLSNEVELAAEEIKQLKMEILNLKGQIKRLQENTEAQECEKRLTEAFRTIDALKKKLNNVKKYIEGN
jgi:hypothetical protein